MSEDNFYNGTEDGSNDNSMAAFENFDISTEYKPDPLIPNGKYRAAVKAVRADAKQFCIVWTLVLQDNDVYASDGETSIDGMELQNRNWLPKPGDENEFSKSGKTTKRQSKINMLKKFADKMKINMSTPQTIAEAISNGDWIGLDVIVDVATSEWKGEVRNEINGMIAA
jgi:hypothetical protein